jgi:Domain of unknown function (DUF6265)
MPAGVLGNVPDHRGPAERRHRAGRTAAGLLAGDAGDSVVIFENTAHDFPQRIGYRKAAGDSLVAWIEGTIEGRSQRVDFLYARVACPGR